jgi:hypothetical protein
VVAAVAAAAAVVAADVAEAAEVVARVAVAEVVESASALEVAAVVVAEDADVAAVGSHQHNTAAARLVRFRHRRPTFNFRPRTISAVPEKSGWISCMHRAFNITLSKAGEISRASS